MPITPEQIVAQARTWLKTPFHHQGRLKHKGVDCIGLIVGVMNELELSDDTGRFLSSYDVSGYSVTPDGYSLKAALDKHFQIVPIDEICPADILLFRFNKNPQHVAFVTDRADGAIGILHCYSTSNYVVEHILDKSWRRLIVAAYRFKPEHLPK